MEVFAFEYDFFPTAGLDNPLQGSPNLEAEISDFKIRAAYPLVLSRSTVLLNRLSYQYLDIIYKNDITNPPFRPDKLHELSYQFSLRAWLGQTWAAILSVNPSLATDFKNVSGIISSSPEDWFWPGKFERISIMDLVPHWSNDFGSIILPVVLVDYYNGLNFHMDLFLPKHVQLCICRVQGIYIGQILSDQQNNQRKRTR